MIKESGIKSVKTHVQNTRTKYKKILETYKTSDIDYLKLMKDLLKHERPILEKQLAYYGGRETKIVFNHLVENPVLTRSY